MKFNLRHEFSPRILKLEMMQQITTCLNSHQRQLEFIKVYFETVIRWHVCILLITRT